MGNRFSPTVRPYEDGGFLGNIVRALDEGVSGYREQRDRTMAIEDRQRGIDRQADEDAMRGVSATRPDGARHSMEMLPGDALPPTGLGAPVGPAMDEDPLEQAMGRMPMLPPEPRSSSGVPGGFDPKVGRFSKPVEPVQLPSGRWYDPQRMMDQRVAEAMQLREAEQGAAESARGVRVGERARGLGALAGTPGYEDLSPGMITAASDNDPLYNALVLRDQRAGGREDDGWQYDSGRGVRVNRRTGAVERLEGLPERQGTGSGGDAELAQEAEGAAWLTVARDTPEIARRLPTAFAVLFRERPELARRPGLAAYYIRKALAAQGTMEGVEARTDATVKRTDEEDPLVTLLRGDAPAAGAARPAAPTAPAKTPATAIPKAPPGTDPKEWEQYLRETGQIP